MGAAKLEVDMIMLDNMTVKQAGEAIKGLKEPNLRGKVLIEISGGVNEDNILEYAKLEPDIISLGSLTHSVKAIDISLEVTETKTGKTKLNYPRTKIGKRQTLDTLTSEEALLFAKFLREERET